MDNSLYSTCGTVVGLVLFYSVEGLHGGAVRAISVCTVAETSLTRFKLFMEQKRLEHGERKSQRGRVERSLGNKRKVNEGELIDKGKGIRSSTDNNLFNLYVILTMPPLFWWKRICYIWLQRCSQCDVLERQ